jgi:hypothetical protein
MLDPVKIFILQYIKLNVNIVHIYAYLSWLKNKEFIILKGKLYLIEPHIDRLRTGRSVLDLQLGKRFFCTPPRPDRLWGSPSLLSSGYWRAHSPRVNRPERKANHSPPTVVKFKGGGAVLPLPDKSTWRRDWLIKHGQIYLYNVTD